MGDLAEQLMDMVLEELINGDYEEDLYIDENAKYLCLECGKEGVIRTNGKTGEQFVGCSGFPTCRNTNNFDIESTEGTED